YKPFHGDIQCGGHAPGSSKSFPCGSEHLPYPLGSRDGLRGTAVLQRGGLNLTAVTVATENNHTVAFLEWRPGSTAQILSDLDLTSQREGRWKRVNTLMHYNVRDGATLILSKVGVSQQPEDSQQDLPGERHALLEEENRVWHLVRPTDEVDEGKSKRGSVKEKERTKAITEIYLTRLLSVKGTLQQFVDNFFQSVLAPGHAVPPAVKYFFDFLDEQAEKHNIQDEDTIHIWKTN
ncbi:PLXNB2 isoform 6, partial [Pan troglodytes]